MNFTTKIEITKFAKAGLSPKQISSVAGVSVKQIKAIVKEVSEMTGVFGNFAPVMKMGTVSKVR